MAYELVSIDELTPEQVASVCDTTYLDRPESFRAKAKEQGKSAVRLYEEAFNGFLEKVATRRLRPYAVCVRPEEVAHARRFLNDRGIGLVVASVVGFPQGARYSLRQKLLETEIAIDGHAKEIDKVFNYDKWNGGEEDSAIDEVGYIVDYADKRSASVKLILETSELSDDAIARICQRVNKTKLAMVKTSTGYGKHGAIPRHVKIMRQNFSRGLKLSGGVTKDNLKDLLRAASGRTDGRIMLDPSQIRIGESTLIDQLEGS